MPKRLLRWVLNVVVISAQRTCSEAAELSDDELASIAGGITEILPILTEARLVIDGNTSILKFSRGIHKTPPSISYGTPSSGD